MSAATAEAPRLVHAIPGRLRVQVPEWSGRRPHEIEAALRREPGIRSAEANPTTGNILISYDATVTSAQEILRAVGALELDTAPVRPSETAALLAAHEHAAPQVLWERQERTVRARIAVPGLDRNPAWARHIVERLQRRPGVRATASALTGRVLVEFPEQEVELHELIAEIAGMDLPDLPAVDCPAHPLDRKPLVQSVTRSVGAAAGLTLVGARRLMGVEEPIATTRPAQANAVISILQSFPIVRNALRRLFGRDVADLLLSVPNIVGLALSDNALGLALVGAESFRLLTEVLQRRAAWRRLEARLAALPAAEPGALVRLEAGDRTPRAATVLEGTGTATGPDGLPLPLAPGGTVPAGARLYGGPFVLQQEIGEAFTPEARPAPVRPGLYERYVQVAAPVSLAYAALAALLMRSPWRALAGLLLVNPRTAMVGLEASALGASARVMRAGVTVVGTRPDYTIRRPHALILDGPRLLADGYEVSRVMPLATDTDATDLLARAATVAAAAGWPWGGALRGGSVVPASEGAFDGAVASARIGDERYSVGPLADGDLVPAALRLQYRGDYLLALRVDGQSQPLGVLSLRPRLASGIKDLVEACTHYGVELGVLPAGDPVAAAALARRAAIPLIAESDAREAIRARQAEGLRVAFVSDNARAALAYALCDLAVALFDGRTHVAARADLVAPDLAGVAAVVEAAGRREAAVRDAVLLSTGGNLVGAGWGFRDQPGIERASRVMYAAALGALGAQWLRLRGGERPGASGMLLADPHPERWGRRGVDEVLSVLQTSATGLTNAEAAARRQVGAPPDRGHPALHATLDQLRSPLTAILAAGAGLSLFFGAAANAAIIAATIGANVAIGAWQERRASQTAEALERIGTSVATVLRAGEAVSIPAPEVVPGDILLLAPGSRVAADARLIVAHHLEVDEASLTGESLPVAKSPDAPTDAGRVILEGSDVTTGTGQAVAVAVGRQTRMGATVAALAADGTQPSPLGTRLSRMLQQAVPLSLAAGAIVVGSGLLRGETLVSLLGVGASIALAAVPEGLPLLSRMGEAAVAHRLADHGAIVRRLSVVEALGRVDVACADKTGTLTQGHLALRLVADADREVELEDGLPPDLRHVLLAAALASPHPDAADAAAHPTDVAITRAAADAGLGDQLHIARTAETPFDPARAFHAVVADSHQYVKGASEAVIPRCAWVRRQGEVRPLDAAGQEELLARAGHLAARGLRVLMVAEGAPDGPTHDPHDLVALGFVGISDPLRPAVAAAVRRCRDAGVRVVMITGDHPTTAWAIAREAGLLSEDAELITGAEIAELQNGALDARLERATVVARATPLDKLRIIESLQRLGHTVAMTGDGVNDAPALRLADAGVAMGRGGTEVARQTADVVLVDDEFATLVDTFIEGRSFWRNIRRALGLLVGGNLGELGLVVGASVLGLAFPLTARQILVVNMVTDILPALAIALQQPEHRNLAALAREGTAALDRPLQADIWRRASASAAPALGAYLLALRTTSLPQARTIAYASIVATQLAQTLDAGWTEGGLNRPVVGAVAGSVGLLAATVAVPPLRTFLGLAVLPPLGWALVGGGAGAAVLMGRALPAPRVGDLDLTWLRARAAAHLSQAAHAGTSEMRLLPPASTPAPASGAT